MATGGVFTNNRIQVVRLPAEARFPDSVKRVEVRVVGQERIISPVDAVWDSFFLGGQSASAEFMEERPTQDQGDREGL